jgi:hypothetical protein
MVVLRINYRKHVRTMVISTPRLSLLLHLGWNYFSFELPHPTFSEKGTTAQWVLLAIFQRIFIPPGSTMSKERGRKRHRPA